MGAGWGERDDSMVCDCDEKSSTLNPKPQTLNPKLFEIFIKNLKNRAI